MKHLGTKEITLPNNHIRLTAGQQFCLIRNECAKDPMEQSPTVCPVNSFICSNLQYFHFATIGPCADITSNLTFQSGLQTSGFIKASRSQGYSSVHFQINIPLTNRRVECNWIINYKIHFLYSYIFHSKLLKEEDFRKQDHIQPPTDWHIQK